MRLNEIYERYKEEFNRTGWHPHPSKLLALRLLQIKDEMFKSILTFNFYDRHKELIVEKIEDVKKGFSISKEEMVDLFAYGDEKFKKFLCDSIDEYNNFEKMAFYQGYEVVRWGNEHYPSATPEEIFTIYSESLRSNFGFPYSGLDYSNFSVHEIIEYFKSKREKKKVDITISLEDIYNEYREEFIETGKRPDFSELLMIKMLQVIDLYKAFLEEPYGFYLENYDLIDVDIDDIMGDFDFSEEDMINYIKEEIDYDIIELNKPKVWYSVLTKEVLGDCYIAMINYLVLNKDRSVEEVYNSFIKAREEFQIITFNDGKRRVRRKSIPINGFKFN